MSGEILVLMNDCEVNIERIIVDCLILFDDIDFDNTNNKKIREILEIFCSVHFEKKFLL